MIITINKQLSRILDVEDEGNGLPSGISKLDEAIYGYQNGKLITVGAVSGCGKTSFITDNIIAAAGVVPVGIFSIEMGTKAIVDRMIYNIAGLNYHRCRKSRTKKEDHLVQEARQQVEKLNNIFFAENADCLYPQFVLDKSSPKDSIELAIEEMYSQGARIFFIDYVQLIRWGFKAESETLRLKEITNKLHHICLQYNVPIVIACQLTKEAANRAVKKDVDPTPTISDIRDGGFIINDSDLILLLHRPDMVGKTNKEINLLVDATEDAQIIIGKGRSSPAGTIRTDFYSYCMSWKDREKNKDELF
jgi:replicative DNA helicase